MILYTGECVHVKFMKDQYKYVNKFEIVTLWKEKRKISKCIFAISATSKVISIKKILLGILKKNIGTLSTGYVLCLDVWDNL